MNTRYTNNTIVTNKKEKYEHALCKQHNSYKTKSKQKYNHSQNNKKTKAIGVNQPGRAVALPPHSSTNRKKGSFFSGGFLLHTFLCRQRKV